MKLRLSFFAYLLFVITGCVHLKNIPASANNIDEIWQPLLKELNVANVTSGIYLDEDLLQKYQAERAEIKEAWQLRAALKKESKKDELLFYQERIERLNDASWQVLENPQNHHVSYPYEILATILAALNDSPTNRAFYAYEASDQIGFCFGRALLAHYLLLKAGIQQEHMYKIFAFDDMRVKQHFWQFHVAILVKDEQAGFLVIDSLQPQVMPYKEWLMVVQKYSLKYPFPQTRFYVAEPRKFLPASGAYDLSWLSSPPLKAYFNDLGREIHQQWHSKKSPR